MAIRSKDKHDHFGMEDAIHHAMFFGDFTTPATFRLTFQWLGVFRLMDVPSIPQ